ncbi:MATE family efflux transporter [Christensenellaceae bacterium NSJ-44]|uniref:Probable multidrug resistance protein NorM n=1 Tax=Luoshenia tenuis TaxID=2763654 RepID=A0A926HI40_9FIRM|nr:MATE family efflux transporter [Luoshenia tenuis]MBC8528377.1 MATE family efflux transporter [Luoshenia tenuis]SCJ77905.1 Na(+)/drug antiporter [uncultured Clostridium sp.]
MPTVISRLFSVESLIKPDRRLGPLPGTKDAYRELLHIALPSVAEMLMVSLVGSIDTMMVGRLGPEAIAAVGLTTQPRMLLLAVFMALNTGVTAIVARRKGEGRREQAQLTLRNASVLILIIAAILMIPSIWAAQPLMLLAGAQADTLADATVYFQILALVLPINALTMAICAAQRGIGNTRITMVVNIVANLVNVVFNFFLIEGNWGFPRLGVAGAAIATAIGFTVGLVLSILSIAHRDSFLHLKLRASWRLHPDILRSIVNVGGNAALEQVAMRIGFFVFARIVADLGTIAFATHQICMQFLNITFTFADGIGVAGTSLVGQYLGKKRPDLSVVFGKISQRIAMIVSLALLSVLIILREPLVAIFNTDPEILALGSQIMIVVALFQPFQTSSVVISGCLRGAGDTRYVARIMLMCVTGIRPLASVLMVYVFHAGLLGAWLSSLLDMSIRVVCVYTRFASCKWFDIEV